MITRINRLWFVVFLAMCLFGMDATAGAVDQRRNSDVPLIEGEVTGVDYAARILQVDTFPYSYDSTTEIYEEGLGRVSDSRLMLGVRVRLIIDQHSKTKNQDMFSLDKVFIVK